VNGGGIDVINSDGSYDQFITVGKIPTNCVFSGRDLYITDAGVFANSAEPMMLGQLLRLNNVTAGLPALYGSIDN
jgi:sugar lactone lactonase YvrE